MIKLKGCNVTHEITEEQLAEICVELCGGGYTYHQTQNAIVMQRDLLDGEKVISDDGRWWEIVQ